MKKYAITLAFTLFLFQTLLFSPITKAQPGQQQLYKTGCQFDEAEHLAVPAVVPMLTRSYRAVPSAYSLKQYTPYAGFQGEDHSCSGWSTSYSASTILWAIQSQQTDRMAITENAFSAYYPYNQVKIHDQGCLGGASIPRCLDIIAKQGVPSINDYPNECDHPITDNNRRQARANKVFYKRLPADQKYIDQRDLIKKSLSENRPVVFSMQVYSSFYKAKEVWGGKQKDDKFRGLHAMTIVGYDDKKSGGAFEVMNSWSEHWGNTGFIWIKYDDLVGETRSLYEISGQKAPSPTKKVVKKEEESYKKVKIKRPSIFKPVPKPKPRKKKKVEVVTEEELVTQKLKGSIALIKDNGVEMPAKIISHKAQKTRGFDVVEAAQSNYKLRMAYPSRTKFRVEIDNNEPAYVYILGSDLTHKTDILFPRDNVSPLIDYQDAAFALPDEYHYIEMDEQKGTDYLCVLYARQALDIEDIRKKIAKEKGHFVEKVNRVLTDQLIDVKDVNFETDSIAFKAKSTDKSTVAIVIEIDHQ